MRVAANHAVAITIASFSSVASAQSFSVGDSVYASPSGSSRDWHSGCVVKASGSNGFYLVECDGTAQWISRDAVRSSPPTTMPDPMRPGQDPDTDRHPLDYSTSNCWHERSADGEHQDPASAGRSGVCGRNIRHPRAGQCRGITPIRANMPV